MSKKHCRSCNAEIIWATTPQGRRIPLDAKPLRVFTINEQSGITETVEGYTSHFATCPDAEQWRGVKR